MKEKIKEAAIQHFNKLGYEGVKMAHIAAEVGLKKQSITYYYSSKKMLAMALYEEVVQQEIDYIQNFFQINRQLPAKEQLRGFLLDLKIRFQQSPRVTFLQILTMLVPYDMQSFIESRYHSYLHILKQEILAVFATERFLLMKEQCTVAYLTLFEGLLMKLVHGSIQAFDDIVDSTFAIFWRGITE